MKQREKRIKRHIISMRISAEEWESLHELMKCLQLKNVSDIMREAFKLVMAPPATLETATNEGQQRIA